MERKRLVNRANVHHGFRSRRDFRLRGPFRTRAGFGLVVAMLCLSFASCADYESAYEQSVQNYVNGQAKAAAAGSSDAAEQAAPAEGGSSESPNSYGSGSAPNGGSSAGGSSPEGFQTIGSGASGVILPGSF